MARGEVGDAQRMNVGPLGGEQPGDVPGATCLVEHTLRVFALAALCPHDVVARPELDLDHRALVRQREDVHRLDDGRQRILEPLLDHRARAIPRDRRAHPHLGQRKRDLLAVDQGEEAAETARIAYDLREGGGNRHHDSTPFGRSARVSRDRTRCGSGTRAGSIATVTPGAILAAIHGLAIGSGGGTGA